MILVKIGYLSDAKGNLTNLVNATRLEIIDGTREIIPLAYGKISEIPRLDVIIGRKFLQGEILFLKNYADFIIDDDHLVKYDLIDLPLYKEKAIYVGAFGGLASFKDVVFTYPFPFRDSSFNSAVIFEVLDLDIIRETHRVLKFRSKVYMILRDEIFGGIDPIYGIKRLAAKFKISTIKEKNGYWIIEGIKIK
ncbi:MAG: hypothetical protein QXN58_04590 [Saccharolobus sp.]